MFKENILNFFMHVSQHGSVCPLTHFCIESDARGCPPLADVFVLLGGKEKVPAPVLGGFTAHPENQ